MPGLLRYTGTAQCIDNTDRALVASAAPNLLLRHLSDRDLALFVAHAIGETCTSGTVVTEIGDVHTAVYFPLDCLISLELPGGLEVAVIGREGMFGWSGVSGLHLSPFRAVVRDRGGAVLKIPLPAMLEVMSKSAAVYALFCQYLSVTAIQSAEALAAHSSHRIEARLARWLLIRHDRVGGDLVIAHHDQIARNIGARRASVTDGLHVLEGDGDIRGRRGKIFIRKRSALASKAAGCYGVGEAHYRTCFGSFGKTCD